VGGVRGEPGGSLVVARTLRDRWGDTEADFQRFYQLDARGAWARPGDPGFLGVRRLAALIRTLPAEARLARIPGDDVKWTVETELLACIVEEVSVLAADRRRRKPLEIPRPGSINQARDQSSGTKVRGLRGLLQVAADAGRVRA
jgi:hypothetical protein